MFDFDSIILKYFSKLLVSWDRLLIVGCYFDFFLNLTRVTTRIPRLQFEQSVGLLFKKLIKIKNSSVSYPFILLHWDREVN